MVPTLAQLQLIAGTTRNNSSNLSSIAVSLNTYGRKFGLDLPHRLAQFIAQVMHESGGGRYDEEIASGKAYEGRKDLGNIHPGDGVKYKGRTELQITGRANYVSYRDWCRKMGFNPPDFEANPDAVKTDPWEGLAAIWFWSTRKLNAYADENNLEQITKKINGGLNGYDDRVRFYIRTALVLLGYAPDDVSGFQQKAKLDVDGDAGPKTRAAMHMALAALSAPVVAAPVTAAPVVTEVAVDVQSPGKGIADTVTGAGVASGGLGAVVGQLQEQLTPFSAAGGWIGKLVVALIIISAVLTIGGLAWRFWAMRKKAKVVEALNAPKVGP